MLLMCSCGERLRVSYALAGQRVKCPSCGRSLVAGRATASVRPAEPKQALSTGVLARIGGGALLLVGLVVLGIEGWRHKEKPTDGTDVSGATPAKPRKLTCKETVTLKNPEWDGQSIAFSPDGKFLAAEGDHGVNVWNTTTGGLPWKHFNARAKYLAFTADGRTLVAGTEELRFIDFAGDDRGKPWFERSGVTKLVAENSLDNPVIAMALSADGKSVATINLARDVCTLKLLDVETGKEKMSGKVPNDMTPGDLRVKCVVLTPDGSLLAWGEGDGVGETPTPINLWDVSAGKLRGTLNGLDGRIDGLSVSADGKVLAAADWNCSVKVWDTQTTKEIASMTVSTNRRDPEKRFDGSSDRIRTLAVSPDGKALAVAFGPLNPVLRDDHSIVEVWDIGWKKAVATLHMKGKPEVRCLAFSPDGAQLAAGMPNRRVGEGDDGEIRILKLTWAEE